MEEQPSNNEQKGVIGGALNNNKNLSLFILTILIISLAIGFWFFGGKKYLSFQKPFESSVSFSNSSNKEQGSLSESSQDVRVIEVKGGMFYFDPSEIRLRKGEKVKVVFTSVDGSHDFVIDELEVRSRVVRTGESDEVEFVASEVGKFEYYCSVGNHRAMGMKGYLIVD